MKTKYNYPSRKIINGILELHRTLCRKQGPYSRTSVALKVWDNSIKSALRKASQKGVIEYSVIGDRVGGAFLLWYEESELTGTRLLHGIALCDPKVIAARKWISNIARKYRAEFKLEMHFLIYNTNTFLIEDLEKCGLYLNDVLLLGSVARAIKRLKQRYPEIDRPIPSRLSIKPIRAQQDLNEALRILKIEFKRNPQYGWFCCHPGFLKSVRKTTLRSMKSKTPTEFMFTHKNKLVGQFGHSPGRYHPHLKSRRAGIGLTFNKHIQGKGLAKYAYYYLLKLLDARGYKYFFGGTAQRPVMHLGRIMGREATGFILTGKKFFNRRHFLF